MNLVVQEIPVDYEFVQQNVPCLWTGGGGDESDGNGVLALIHVGVSGIASKITIETQVRQCNGDPRAGKTDKFCLSLQAHNSGYLRKDVNGKCPGDGR